MALSQAPAGSEQGSIRWGSDYTGGNWWDQYLDADGTQPVIRSPDGVDDQGFARFRYFWADRISSTFFWWSGLDEDLQDLWLGDWEPTTQA